MIWPRLRKEANVLDATSEALKSKGRQKRTIVGQAEKMRWLEIKESSQKRRARGQHEPQAQMKKRQIRSITQIANDLFNIFRRQARARHKSPNE
jgi:hypothetical protein